MPKLLIQNAEIRHFSEMLSKVSEKFSRTFEMFLTVFPDFLFTFRQFKQTFKKVEKSVQNPKYHFFWPSRIFTPFSTEASFDPFNESNDYKNQKQQSQ